MLTAIGHDIWIADTKAKAEKAYDLFIETFEAKYPKTTACLAKDRDVLLTFYGFPAEHWSTFARRIRSSRCSPPCGCGIARRRARVRASPA